MTAGWVAASTRGGALVRRLVGPDGAREIAGADSWHDARNQLATTFYGTELEPGADRRVARHEAITATVWQLRVLAGWLPVGGSGVARLFAAPLEIGNIEHHLAAMSSPSASVAVPLGSLAVAWPRIATTSTAEEIQHVLTRSAWGDPGGLDPVALAVGLRVAWARRLVRGLPVASEWARGGLAVLVAREIFAFRRQLAPVTGRAVDQLLGRHWRRAASLSELTDRLPASAAWALEGISEPQDLWRAEAFVAQQIASDAAALVATRRPTQNVVAALMALLLLDLRRVTAAIEIAGRGPNPVEAFDAVA